MNDQIQVNFNKVKALNAILYVANRLKRKDLHKIFKVLYFSDRNHLSTYGRTITGDTYIAMEDGPVPSKIYDILKSVRGEGYFTGKEDFSDFFRFEDWEIIKPLKEANLKALSKTDISLLDESIKEYGGMSWEEVRDKSHDFAWSNTVRNRPISFENIALEAGNEEEFISYLKEHNMILRNLKHQ